MLIIILFIGLLSSSIGLGVGRQLRARSHTRYCSSSLLDAPTLNPAISGGNNRTFFIETHGCQMNLADSDIVRSVLHSAGYHPTDNLENADLILTNTCAIRENAEAKVYHRLKYFASLRKKNKKSGSKPDGYPLVGLLGCMAERLKTKLFEDKSMGISFIAGPDAYRELPNLLMAASTDQRAASTQLSVDETYADISPVRLAEGNTHAFVTITRGCNNMCSFCIVPYTRGRERSRNAESIVAEVCLLREQGYKEVVLLGQNVNSYHDRGDGALEAETLSASVAAPYMPDLAEGFKQKWKAKVASSLAPDVDFGELLLRVSAVDPEMRIRFQAPHPKDFPDAVLNLIARTPNICNSLHMPAQHGSSSVLERMQRGYSKEAYVNLVDRARSLLGRGTPEGVGMGLSSDFISGFCGETEEEHSSMLNLVREVGFDQAFTYSYSRREQTYAGLFMQDDVPSDVKARRLTELVDTFQQSVQARNSRLESGRLHVVLVEGEGSKGGWTGRTDSNKRVVFGDLPVLRGLRRDDAAVLALEPPVLGNVERQVRDIMKMRGQGGERISKGSYIAVKVLSSRGHTLRGIPIALTTLTESSILNLPGLATM